MTGQHWSSLPDWHLRQRRVLLQHFNQTAQILCGLMSAVLYWRAQAAAGTFFEDNQNNQL